MKIRGRIFQERNIRCKTKRCFSATYRGHDIYVRDDGSGQFDHLRSYLILVTAPNGTYCVQNQKDFHTITDAIGYALEGSLL